MTILTSTTESTPFTPSWLCLDDGVTPQPDAPVFLLRAGSIIERGQMEAELAGQMRAGLVNPFHLYAEIRDGLRELLRDDPGLDALLALVEVEAQGEVATLTDDERRSLDEIRKILAEHWPGYADLVAQSARRRALAPLVALRRFCTDIRAPGVTFARGRDGFVADSALATFDQIVLTVVGGQALELQYPSAEKNLPRPSPSDAAPPISPAAEASRTGGSSTKRTGRKTPASRSPPGRSKP